MVSMTLISSSEVALANVWNEMLSDLTLETTVAEMLLFFGNIMFQDLFWC